MTQDRFRAFVVSEEDGKYVRRIQSRSVQDLPAGDLLIHVRYSSLNYKDALSATGNKGVTKDYPHTPGIDAVGTVVASDSDAFGVGQTVIVTGFDLGMSTDGGFAQYIRVPSTWPVALPSGLTMREAMMLGTAGLTAGISVSRLSEAVTPDRGTIVVSGATGGVGALSVSILSKLGYRVAAITGKESARARLQHLGAHEVIPRAEFEASAARPLLKGVWAGGIDTVGGGILANMIKSVQPMGVVTCCGNVASSQLDVSLFPFILRGVSLIGIDSQNYPRQERVRLWNRLAGDWKPERLADTCEEISLQELDARIERMLRGGSQGRSVVNLDLACRPGDDARPRADLNSQIDSEGQRK